jgi:hypothetical protein
MRAWEAVSDSHRKRRLNKSKSSGLADGGSSGSGSGSSNNNNVSNLKKRIKLNQATSGFRSLLRKAPKSASLHHMNGSGSDSSASSTRAGFRSRLGSSEEVRDESEMVVTSYTKPEKHQQRHHHHHHHRHKHSGGGARPKEEKFSRH